MKKTINIALAIAAMAMTFTACKKKEVKTPDVEEQELITTMKLMVTDLSGTQTFIYKIENGFGSTTQGTVQIDTIKLSPGATYSYNLEILNESEVPAENITSEVIAEKNEHLFLLTSDPASGNGSIAVSNGNKDNNNLPFNLSGTLTAGTAGNGTFTVSLIHAPTNKNGATTAETGGETDAEAVFPVLIQ